MNILQISKYPPIQGGVSAESYWRAQALSEVGFNVVVLTNADEVEQSYRITLSDSDQALLSGFRRPNSIRVLSTHADDRHTYIPQGNPAISKMLGLGIAEINQNRPDVIMASYMEPYGVVGMLLSQMFNIPYVVGHAGSDIGRLYLTEQLAPVYREVFRRSLKVITSPRHHDFFLGMGVEEQQFLRLPLLRLPGDVFFPTEIPAWEGVLTLHNYGKPGRAKSTKKIIQAVGRVKEKLPVQVVTHWGGQNLSMYEEAIQTEGLSQHFINKGYVPHWKIPESIRGAHVGLYLEDNFSISFHSPGIPYEYWSCGRPVILSKEIAQKDYFQKLVKPGSTYVIESSPIEVEELVEMIFRASAEISYGEFMPPVIDASVAGLGRKQALKSIVESLV